MNTYGIPTYKEANPALFACVSFPFFFGIMFGDIMHGSILFTFAACICFSERKPGSFSANFGKHRYFFLLMGLFAIFGGLIYNDFTSLTTYLAGDSCYTTKDL